MLDHVANKPHISWKSFSGSIWSFKNDEKIYGSPMFDDVGGARQGGGGACMSWLIDSSALPTCMSWLIDSSALPSMLDEAPLRIWAVCTTCQPVGRATSVDEDSSPYQIWAARVTCNSVGRRVRAEVCNSKKPQCTPLPPNTDVCHVACSACSPV